MKVLLIGSGGREHALAWKLSTSPLLTKLYCTPGNPGISEIAECVDLPNHQDIVHFCQHNKIDLVMVGPETPLVDGLADLLRAEHIAVIGPSAKAAQLEGSKGFTKDLCRRYQIPTGDYERFDNAESAKAYIRQKGAPIVVKADGLAAGKGVIVAMSKQEALDAVDSCFDGAFGSAGTEVVVEEFLDGEEASFFCLCDGKTAIPLTSAQDHKRVGDGDTGVNTGGMGAYSPAPIMTNDMIERTMNEIVEPTMRGMAEMGAPFTGILFIGLMITKKGPELIEFNVRFGDPECQVLMMRLESDLLPVLQAAAKGDLSNISLQWSNETALTVVLCAKGYPQSPEKGGIIEGVKQADEMPHVKIFQAGTALKNGALIANGGRVLNVTAKGDTVTKAHERAYDAIKKINWPEGFCRKDIGWRAMKKENKN